MNQGATENAVPAPLLASFYRGLFESWSNKVTRSMSLDESVVENRFSASRLPIFPFLLVLEGI